MQEGPSASPGISSGAIPLIVATPSYRMVQSRQHTCGTTLPSEGPQEVRDPSGCGPVVQPQGLRVIWRPALAHTHVCAPVREARIRHNPCHTRVRNTNVASLKQVVVNTETHDGDCEQQSTKSAAEVLRGVAHQRRRDGCDGTAVPATLLVGLPVECAPCTLGQAGPDGPALGLRVGGPQPAVARVAVGGVGEGGCKGCLSPHGAVRPEASFRGEKRRSDSRTHPLFLRVKP